MTMATVEDDETGAAALVRRAHLVERVRERIDAGQALEEMWGDADRHVVPAPAGVEAVREAEALVGAPLPPLLRDLYGVANGGFGPAYGLLGLRGGYSLDGRTAVDVLSEVAKGYWPGRPAGLLPLCDWGCAILTWVHCPTGKIYGWDPNPVAQDDDVPFFEQEYDLPGWLEAWLDGRLQQPFLIVQEDGTYRGATIAETREAISGDSA